MSDATFTSFFPEGCATIEEPSREERPSATIRGVRSRFGNVFVPSRAILGALLLLTLAGPKGPLAYEASAQALSQAKRTLTPAQRARARARAAARKRAEARTKQDAATKPAPWNPKGVRLMPVVARGVSSELHDAFNDAMRKGLAGFDDIVPLDDPSMTGAPSCTTSTCLTRYGASVGATRVIVVVLGSPGGQLSLSARLFDAENQRDLSRLSLALSEEAPPPADKADSEEAPAQDEAKAPKEKSAEDAPNSKEASPAPQASADVGTAEAQSSPGEDAAPKGPSTRPPSPTERLARATAERVLTKFLAPEAYVGTLYLQSPQGGAAIFIDDELVGETPLPAEGLRLEAGSHILRASAEGFADVYRFIDVPFRDATTISIDLETNSVDASLGAPLPPPPSGQLTISKVPPGVALRVNGTAPDISVWPTVVPELLVEQSHSIEVRQQGPEDAEALPTQTRKFDIKDKQNIAVRIHRASSGELFILFDDERPPREFDPQAFKRRRNRGIALLGVGLAGALAATQFGANASEVDASLSRERLRFTQLDTLQQREILGEQIRLLERRKTWAERGAATTLFVGAGAVVWGTVDLLTAKRHADRTRRALRIIATPNRLALSGQF